MDKLILGIDPGTIATGYAVIVGTKVLDLGCIRPPKDLLLSERYAVIHEGILFLIEKFKPSDVAVETPFVHKNMQSALKLGGALASIVLAAKKHSLPTFGYPPREVKLAVCGRGGAAKEDVAMAATRHVGIQIGTVPADALDALAIALTHHRFPAPRTGAKHPKLM